MIYFAHSGTPGDKSDWQLLRDHLVGTAGIAAAMGEPLGLKKAVYIAGLLHDLGKFTREFQKRLEGGKPVDHSTAGARLLLDLCKPQERFVAELCAYAILGHHAGLPDRQASEDSRGSCMNDRLEAFTEWPDEIWKSELVLDTAGMAPQGFSYKRLLQENAFTLSVMGRMIFSCLVDADFRETEQFYNQLTGETRDRQWPDLQDLLPQLIDRFDSHMARFAQVAAPKPQQDALQKLRGHILTSVRANAVASPGLFTLTVPTGGGKTLASLGFALDHARAHGARRIIYAIPFTSIIDQTADIFRDALGEDVILEHHSAIESEKYRPDSNGATARGDKMRLAMEDWAAPVVVTTNVQFFESLFAARPSRARKLHNIAGSVIILDEAQTLPRKLLLPAIRMLEELCTNYKCSVVLCTATQPALGKSVLKEQGLELDGRELAPDPHGLSQQLRRATIRMAGDMNDAALVDALRGDTQAMIIVNSRKHALALYREADNAGLDGLVHLTTRQYAAHRRRILADIRGRLKDKQPCRVIATSLVEAGVDIDFPKVWRAEAGLDQIIQAAGRCNREGTRSCEDSIVTVFSAPDYPPPSEIVGLVNDMRRMLPAHAHDLMSLAAIEAYFQEVYWRAGDKLDARKILEHFSLSAGAGSSFAYRTVAEKFRMIESPMVPVIVAKDDDARKAAAKLGVETVSSGSIARDLQSYIVQIPAPARQLLLDNEQVRFECPELRGDQFVVLQDNNLYKPDTGLIWEDAGYLDPTTSIF